MFDKYLITGATGFLGRAVAAELVRRDAQVRALVLHNDPYISLLPKEVRTVAGDVCDKSSLADFFGEQMDIGVITQHKRMHLRSAAYQLLRNSPTEEAGSACNKILIKHAKSLLSNKHTSVDYLSQVQYT